jgi:hypothetical protein
VRVHTERDRGVGAPECATRIDANV